MSQPYDLVVEPVSGDIYVGESLNSRVQIFTPTGSYVQFFGKLGTGAGEFSDVTGIAINASHELYAVDGVGGRVERWKQNYSTSNPLPQPPLAGSSSTWTVEYKVPLSGGALPTMTEAEVSKWGQKDDPEEAMAMFPPVRPMGWPAKEYELETINYMDEQGHTVNVASPTGGISTTEYDETNDVKRTLSADNRAVALKEAKPAEAAEKLDAREIYSGSRLVESLGPEHKVKLAVGKEGKHNEEVSAREQVKYFYDEGSPEGKSYGLLTRTVDSALVGGKEEEPRTTITSYSGQGGLGWTLRRPTSVTVDPNGLRLTHTTVYEPKTGQVLETTGPAGSMTYLSQFGSKGSGEGQLSEPAGMTLDGGGNVWVADANNNRIEEFNSEGSYITKCGSFGTGEGQFNETGSVAYSPVNGNLYVTDRANNRVQEISTTACKFVAKFGETGSETEKLKAPMGIAVDASGNVWVADFSDNKVKEYSASGAYLGQFGESGSGNGQFAGANGLALCDGNLYVTDSGNTRVQEFTLERKFVMTWGKEGSANGQFKGISQIACNPANGNVFVGDKGNNRFQEFTPGGIYIISFGSTGTSAGQFSGAKGITITPNGNTIYAGDLGNNRIERWTMQAANSEAVHNTRTIYYTTEEEAEAATCRNHPEWANLPCQTMPVAQPTNTTASAIPTVTQLYNALDEVTTTTEAFPTSEHFAATTRTKTETYDAAGRALTSEETATVGIALPKTTNKYNSETGALEQQSTPTKTITAVANTLGQLTSYTDADANTTKYTYDLNGRPEEVSDPKGKQSYAYSGTTGLMTKLVDSGAGTFNATYDVEGKMLTDTLPDGLIAKYAYNALGTATGIEYEKKTYCEKSCPENWFSDVIIPSIHGETITQASSLSSEAYGYDNAGRLTETQEITASKTCKARLYAYDEEGNRVSETNRESSTETCPTEGGTVERHVYDAANRLIDSGVVYDALGNETEIPAGDAGGYKLTSTFYADSQVATQNQHEETIEYSYDPAGRTRETTAKSIKTITHYSGPGEALSWSAEGTEKWSRNIPGIDGALDAIQTSTGTITLQIHDLQGNIVGQVGTSETETKLQSSFNSTEFGVPIGSKTPAKYAWLGAAGVKTMFETGITSEGGASYVPQIGRGIQTASVVPPGAFPNGSGPGTPEETVVPGWISIINERESAATLAEWAAIQEGEDPCTSTFAQGEYSFLGKQIMAAWADVEWCYTRHKVKSAKMKYQKYRIKDHWYEPEWQDFVGWGEEAKWILAGNPTRAGDPVEEVYFIERTAVFKGKLTEIPLPVEWEGSVLPNNRYYIALRFELFPGGYAKAWATYWNEFGFEGPE
jgi:YD repeat-containing protein